MIYAAVDAKTVKNSQMSDFEVTELFWEPV